MLFSVFCFTLALAVIGPGDFKEASGVSFDLVGLGYFIAVFSF